MKNCYLITVLFLSVLATAQVKPNNTNKPGLPPPIDLNRMDYTREPNSYIFDLDVAQNKNYGGIYIFVKKAYDMWNSYSYLQTNGSPTPIPDGLQSASVAWEDVPGLITNVSILPGANAAFSKIKVDINRAKGKGNAVIAFKVNKTTYWSWHVWVTDNPANGVQYSQDFETDMNNNPIQVQYMDRNLGALSNNFLGDNWNKSGGLLYEWGRKDPFPSLLYKDYTYYELNGDVGSVKHSQISTNSVPTQVREFNEIEKNMQFSVKNPFTYIINSDATGNWFSSSRYRTAGTGTSFVTWDLWSDNAKGTNGNASSSDPAIKAESKSYEMKSQLDPCPNGWRVPSYYGRVTMNNNLGPWGRKNSGANDDAGANSKILPDSQNLALDGIKVYPGLGMDFTNAQNGARNLGVLPISGNYEYYPNPASPNSPIQTIYQDGLADGSLLSATYGYDGVRSLGMISDPGRTDISAVGQHSVYVNQTTPTREGHAVRCMKDPNLTPITNFETEYFTSPKTTFTDGLQNPNSYIVKNGETALSIPVNKAFSVYNQLLTDHEMLAGDQLVAKVLWTSNVNLVKTISIDNSSGDSKNSLINVVLNPSERGNFVISLHNGSTDTPAYWSWYVWVPESDPIAATVKYVTETPIPTTYNFVNPTKSGLPPLTTEFMDRNLGAMKAFPNVGDANFAADAALAKGLHFQWGRKDPIPTFVKTQANSQDGEIYLGSENASKNGVITYSKITNSDYENLYSVPFNSYKSTNAVKYKRVEGNIAYSVQNPLKFLYQEQIAALYDGGNKANNDLTKIKDWVLDEPSQAQNRWGHADKKSVYDPCPEGWRIPDVSAAILYNGSKGSSPWYNSFQKDAYGKDGVIQDQWHDASTYYGATVSPNSGISFNNANYNLKGFAFDGMRGELGEKQLSNARSGVWTASLADNFTGYALAMEFQGNYVQTGTGAYPQAAMGVRCAKDEARYLGVKVSKVATPNAAVLKTSEQNISVAQKLYPNPFSNELFSENSSAKSYEIFDFSGRLITAGMFENGKINTANLQKGVYVIKVTLKTGETFTKKIMKN